MVNINDKKLCENCFCETTKEPCPECGFDQTHYTHDPMVLAIGSILENRYVIGGVIGKGGFGITYLAYDMKLECKVAIKEYYPFGLALRNIGSTQVTVSNVESADSFKNGADKFYKEARLVAKFNGNPNIVSVHDIFYENDTVYFTMGFLKGQTLKAYIKEHGVLSSEQAVCVAGDISNALMAAHSLDVLHRDISPDNIMVCSDGTIKLLDFGAARQVMAEGSQSLSVILKQGFAPLEQYQKKGKQGPWTDIYSLGATLYYALTLDMLDDPMSRLDDDLEYSSNNHGIPEELWQIIRKATMLKIPDRYQDIFEFKKDLKNISIKPQPLVKPELPGKGKFTAHFVEEQNQNQKPVGENEPEKIPEPEKPLQEEVPVMGVVMPDTGWEDRMTDSDATTPMPLEEKKPEIGVTMPLKENEPKIGVTMPLKESESEIGVTMPWKEKEPDIGITMPLEEDIPVYKSTMPQKAKTSGVSNKIKIAIAGGAAACVLLVAILIGTEVFSSNDSDEADTTTAIEAATTEEKKDDTKYANYVNSNVSFSVDYPEGYQTTEQEQNGVWIMDSDEKNFQVSIQYACMSKSDSVIYSAKDFSEQVKANSKVLTDWIGIEGVSVTDSKETAIGGKSGYKYDFEVQINGKKHLGTLYVCDGNGKFGCYSFQILYNEESSEKETYIAQCDAMVNSFQITGAYQEPGYEMYSYNNLNTKLLLKPEEVKKTKEEDEKIVVYPVEGIFTEANIWIYDTSFESSKDATQTLELLCKHYFEDEQQAQYLSQNAKVEYGRYDYTGSDLQYVKDGKKYNISVFIFPCGSCYRKVTMMATDEYYETAAKVTADLLYSMQVGDTVGSKTSSAKTEKTEAEKTETAEKTTSVVKGMVSDVITSIQKQSGFVKNGTWEPLAVVNDFNGDGGQEFLTIYEMKSSDDSFNIMYELWSFAGNGAAKLKSEVLYAEVGGNSGFVGIVNADGKRYLAIERHEPQGDQFNNYCIYFPWEKGQDAPGDESVYLESHGTYGEEAQGRYILGDQDVDQSTFEGKQKSFSNWVYKLDILSGAGNGDVMSYEDILSSLK